MIIEGIVSALWACVEFVLGLIFAPISAPPASVVEAVSWVGDVWLLLQSFEAWLPVTFTFTVAGIVAGVYGISLAIGLSRTILSYFTFGGGAR